MFIWYARSRRCFVQRFRSTRVKCSDENGGLVGIMTLRKGRYATNEVLGLTVEDFSGPAGAKQECIVPLGVIIRKIVSGKAAHHAGLNIGDIIIRVGDEAIRNTGQFCELINKELRKGEVKLLIRDRERKRSITLVFLTVK